MTVVRFRWLLALLAVLTPAACLHRSERTPTDPGQGAVGLASAAAETVFRHYV